MLDQAFFRRKTLKEKNDDITAIVVKNTVCDKFTTALKLQERPAEPLTHPCLIALTIAYLPFSTLPKLAFLLRV